MYVQFLFLCVSFYIDSTATKFSQWKQNKNSPNVSSLNHFAPSWIPDNAKIQVRGVLTYRLLPPRLGTLKNQDHQHSCFNEQGTQMFGPEGLMAIHGRDLTPWVAAGLERLSIGTASWYGISQGCIQKYLKGTSKGKRFWECKWVPYLAISG